MMKLLCSAAVLGTNFTSEISWTVKTENVTYIDSLSFFLSFEYRCGREGAGNFCTKYLNACCTPLNCLWIFKYGTVISTCVHN